MNGFLPFFERDPHNIPLEDGKLLLFSNQFSDPLFLFKSLYEKTPWRQDSLFIAGKEVLVPRLNAWFGDPGKNYSYSGVSFEALHWFEELLFIKHQVEETCQVFFNSALLNLYRDGNDSVDWHSDDEPELGVNPTIASVSLGQKRRFLLKHRYKASVKKVSLELEDNSILLMKGAIQHNWLHKVSKTVKPCQPRINITFRNIIN